MWRGVSPDGAIRGAAFAAGKERFARPACACYTYGMQFEWDDDKAQVNLAKHGVAFEEALTCFYDPEQVAFYDPDHSEDEDRELPIGHSSRGRLLVVS